MLLTWLTWFLAVALARAAEDPTLLIRTIPPVWDGNEVWLLADASLNITVFNAHSGEHSPEIGLVWWSFGMALAAAYFVFVYRMFRGKIAGTGDKHGY